MAQRTKTKAGSLWQCSLFICLDWFPFSVPCQRAPFECFVSPPGLFFPLPLLLFLPSASSNPSHSTHPPHFPPLLDLIFHRSACTRATTSTRNSMVLRHPLVLQSSMLPLHPIHLLSSLHLSRMVPILRDRSMPLHLPIHHPPLHPTALQRLTLLPEPPPILPTVSPLLSPTLLLNLRLCGTRPPMGLFLPGPLLPMLHPSTVPLLQFHNIW